VHILTHISLIQSFTFYLAGNIYHLITKPNLLIMCRKLNSLGIGHCTKQVNTFCGQNVGFQNVSCGKYSNHWAIKGEDYIVLGCDIVYFCRQVPTLWSQEVPINAGHI